MDNPVKAYPEYDTISRRGASPLPSDNNVIFNNETCKNQPTNPLMNSQFRTSGVNLAREEKIQNQHKQKDEEAMVEIIPYFNSIATWYLEVESHYQLHPTTTTKYHSYDPIYSPTYFG